MNQRLNVISAAEDSLFHGIRFSLKYWRNLIQNTSKTDWDLSITYIGFFAVSIALCVMLTAKAVIRSHLSPSKCVIT